MRHADAGKMEAPLPARVEAHRCLEMLDGQIGLSSEQTKPTAPIPGERETRVERESPIHQGKRGINVLAETPEYHRRPAEHTRVVGRKTNSPPGQFDRGPAIFIFIAIVGPVVVFKINAVGSGLSKSGAVARFAHNRLFEQVKRLRDVILFVARPDRAGAQVEVVCGKIAGWPLDREAYLGGLQR